MLDSIPLFNRYAWADAWRDPIIVAEAMNDHPHPLLDRWASALRGEAEFVLDLGTGLGRNLLPLLEQGYTALGLDISAAGLSRLYERLEAQGLPTPLLQADMYHLPFAPTTFDWVIAFQVLHHERSRAITQLFRGVHRILRPGGHFLFDLLSTGTASHEYRRTLLARGGALEVEPNTFVAPDPILGGEMLPHHYTSRAELGHFLEGFTAVECLAPAEQAYATNHWVVMAHKVENWKVES
ncbi:MAG: class I SAM-dependent methyltransferase [Ardenticatenaceae bacterium]|nr:class I SAM-dependent methyltransferase [Ardenticatenaceae bacterium]